MDLLRDKAQLKQACKRLGIPTARFSIIDFQQQRPVEELVNEVEQEVGSYPMFRKPINGFGSGGGGVIGNTRELEEFINEMSGQPAVSPHF